MRKLFLMLSFFATISLTSNQVFAQDTNEDSTQTETTEAVEETPEEVTEEAAVEEPADEKAQAPEEFGHQMIMHQFIEGGPLFMSIVLICLILGLAFAIERIITLALSSTNSRKLLASVEDRLAAGDVDGAKEICKSNRSPIASVLYQGLDRVNDGVDIVEKSILAYGSVQMGLLERGLTWISLFIALAPMLGFMGTVIGMISAFDAIAAAGDISPSIVAGGIKVALLTTVFGLIVAVILQIFYNYIVSRIDSIVNDMEDASISFIDMIIRHNVSSK